MSRPLDWEREGRIWPNRAASGFVQEGRATWHVQRMGDASAPRVLLLHGTGASVHSWRDVMPLMAREFAVLAPDLPRHAFTTGHLPDDTSLPRMAKAIRRLLDQAQFEPDIIVGHSAGAALALQLALDHGYTGPTLVLNSALRPFAGIAAQLFPALAKALFVNPFVPRLFSGMAKLSGDSDRFLAKATGSQIDAESLACYEALLSNARHTKGALAMMANWDLPTLRTRMQEIANPILMVHSDRDAAIPLDWAKEAHGWLATSRLEVLEGFGHLAHEENPEAAARLIAAFAAETLGAPVGEEA